MKTIIASCLALLLSVPAFAFKEPPRYGNNNPLYVGLAAVGGGGFLVTVPTPAGLMVVGLTIGHAS